MENGESSGQASTENISVHDFSEKLLEQMVHFHVMKLTGGFFLWVGTSPVLSNLAVSMNSRFVSCMPVVYGGGGEDAISVVWFKHIMCLLAKMLKASVVF